AVDAVMKRLGEDEQIQGQALNRPPAAGLRSKVRLAGPVALATGEYSITVEGKGKFSIVYANENMALKDDQGNVVAEGKELAQTPKLICVLRLDRALGHWLPFTNDSLQKGDEIASIVA